MGSPKKRIQYRYDSRGNRSALIDPDGGRFTYAYDAVSRITEVQNPQGDRTTYSYDAAGRRTVKQLANGTRASFTYDAAGNLTKLSNLKSTGALISSFDYTYDKVGNRTAVLEGGGSRVTWSYDAAYQLTGEHRTGANPYRDTFTYDLSGNRLLKNHDGARTTYAYDAANQLTYSQDASGRTTYTFDADGNQQVVQPPSGDRTTYAWDYENRMTQALLPASVRNTMAYDADGLRVKLEESTGTKKFIWDNQNYLGETDANDDTQVIYTNEPLVYGNLVSQRRGSATHWYQFDALGSTRELTDASEIITDTRLYDAWGNEVASSGSTVSPFRWVGNVGYYFDTQQGTYYVRARVYQPVIARWVSVDPLRFFVRDSATYEYGSGRPGFYTDPSGMLSQETVRIPVALFFGIPLCFGSCGAWRWTTRWILEQGERDGYIIQIVKFTFTPPTTCDGKHAAPEVPPANPSGQVCSYYAELWTIGTNVTTGPLDTFSNLGYTACSIGDIRQRGEAFFLKRTDIPDNDSFCNPDTLFTPGGVRAAGGLRSVCMSPRVKRCINKYKAKKAGALTVKSMHANWKCCPCKKGNYNVIDARIGGQPQQCRALDNDCLTCPDSNICGADEA